MTAPRPDSPPSAAPVARADTGHPNGGVLFVIRSLGFGGAERQVVALARGLATRGHRVGVLTYYDGGALREEVVRAGIPVYTLGKRGRWDMIGPYRRAVAITRAFRPSVIHGYLSTGNLLSLALRVACRNCRVAMGVRGSARSLSQYDRLTTVTELLGGRLARYADIVIANSQAGADHLRAHGCPASRIAVIPNGIDTERFRPDGGRRQATRDSLGLGDHEVLVGLIGRLDPLKDHRTFLRAAAKAVSSKPRLRFLCVGDGPEDYRRALEAEAASLGLGDRVRWLPAQREIAAVYCALDLLCSASTSEGFSNVIGEALACGIPCVATDVGDTRQLLDGVGIVVPPGDPAALAGGLLDAAATRSPQLAQRCRQRILDHFSVDRLLRATAVRLGLEDG